MIVAFSGPAGAGKSTAMKALDPQRLPAIPGYIRDNWIHLPFAGPLKSMLAGLIGWEAINDRELREKPHPLLGGKTPRHGMQTLGEEWGRQLIYEDLWAGIWREQARTVLDHGGYVVVDDLRFPNEAGTVHGMGGCIIEVTRPGVRRSGDHPSEAYTPDYDYEVVNDGTPEHLQLQVLRKVADYNALLLKEDWSP